MKKLLYNFKVAFAGLIMTIIDSIPGLSGAVFISVGGTLQKLWTAWENFLHPKEKKKFISTVIFYFCFGVGSMVGMVGFAKVISMCLNHIPSVTFWFFLTASIGGVLIYYKSNKSSLKSKSRKQITKYSYFAIGALVIFIMTIIILLLQGRQSIFDVREKTNVILEENTGALTLLLLAGFFSAYAMFTPGLSGGLILLLFNSYNSVYSGLMRDPMSHKVVFILYSVCVLAGIISAILSLDKMLKKFPTILSWILFGIIVASQFSIITIFNVFIPSDNIRWLLIVAGIIISSIIIYSTLLLMNNEKVKI